MVTVNKVVELDIRAIGAALRQVGDCSFTAVIPPAKSEMLEYT